MSQGTGKLSSAQRAVEVTPSDSIVYAECRAIYVGGAGDLTIRTRGGDTVTLASVPAGSLLPINADQIRSTDTTATSIVVLF